MLNTIQRDHEIICRNCGCVVDEQHEIIQEKALTPVSINIHLLGSTLEKNKKYAFTQTPYEFYQERVLRKLIDITKEFALPESFALDVFNDLKRQKRGFRSETQPIKQLIKLLSKDDNYIHINKMRAIKAKYESILNH